LTPYVKIVATIDPQNQNDSDSNHKLKKLFFSIYKEVEEITENWVKQFNEERPHESLGNLTPKEYLAVNQ